MQSQLWIVLQEDESRLNEVVVVGYETQKKSNMAGVVKIVKDIEVSEESISQICTRIGDVKVALWRPDLRSDADGNFTLDFDVANENTTWCLKHWHTPKNSQLISYILRYWHSAL